MADRINFIYFSYFKNGKYSVRDYFSYHENL